MNIDFVGRRALVTGGTRGIGLAIVRTLASAGARVVATGSSEGSIATCEPIDGVELAAIDLADVAATERFAAASAGGDFDILVNNAGINKLGLAGELDVADWDRIQTVNVRAPMVLCRALVCGMAARSYGRIVNVSSIFGDVSRSERASYTTSKYALRGLTRTLALDYASRNVLVNAIAPGFIDTDLTRTVLGPAGMRAMSDRVPMKRLGTVDEIARVVVFLASEVNSYMTGQHVVVDGGFTSE
jgi:3-oxoacyl-[acyl-carrier protein] reductase